MELVMDNSTTDRIRFEKAKKKAKDIRGFYINLTLYCLVIPILITINLTYVPEIQWFWFSMLGWGTGIVAHAMEVFGWHPFLGKDWEERKLKQFMDEEREKNEKNKHF
jgi:hypothetical protein